MDINSRNQLSDMACNASMDRPTTREFVSILVGGGEGGAGSR
jgi:hypothetical protein